MIDLFGDVPAPAAPAPAEKPIARARAKTPFPRPGDDDTEQPAAVAGPMAAPLRTFKTPTLASLMPEAVREASLIIPEAKAEQTDEEDRSRLLEDLDRLDEEAIVTHLRGGFIDRFVYEYCQSATCESKKKLHECRKPGGCSALVHDLSWYGIQEASRVLRVTVAPGLAWRHISPTGEVVTLQEAGAPDPGVVVMEHAELVRVVVRATDPQGLSRVGVAQQKRQQHYQTRSGQWKVKDDDFYAQKAMSKAERNALRQLIPQLVMRAWIDSYLDEQRAKALPPPKPPAEAASPIALPPALPPRLSYDGKLQKILALLEQHGYEGYDYRLDKIRSRCPDDKTAGYVLKQWDVVEKRAEIVRWMTPDA